MVLLFFRYKSKSLPRMPNCGHNTKTYKCSTLSMQDVRRFHQAFYQTSRKVLQDNFILKYTSQSTPQRSRAKIPSSSRKAVAIKYLFKTKSGCVQVCSNTFLQILGISRDRVQRICRNHLVTNQSPKEKRGGDRRSEIYSQRRQAVHNYIMNLRPVESHYTREKSTRQYLPSDCSIKQLWRAYNNNEHVDNSLKVKYHFFRDIFVSQFNISFKSPATDACSDCIRLKEAIKRVTGTEKISVMTTLTVHKLRAKAFYSLMKQDDPSTLILSCDCEKNLVLPKVPDQSAYYSRQLYQYNFTICEGHSKAKQNTDSVTIYSWCENEHNKGSNEIASSIYDKLSHVNLNNVTQIRLFTDSCPGQNKYSIIVGKLATISST